MWRTGGKKTKNRKANSSPGNWEKSDGLTAGTLPCCSLQLQSFYCLRPSSFGLVTMSQFVSITCTSALDRAQLCFTITEHWHRRGWTDFGLTKIHLLFIHVLDYSTVLPSPRRSECTFCCHFFLKDVNKKKRPVLCVGVFFCLFSVMQKQGCLSLFLLSASPAGLSILSPLFFSSAKLFLSSHTINPPTPFSFLSCSLSSVMLSWGFFVFVV